MVTHPVTFTGKQDGISIQHPPGITIKITAIGQVYNFPFPIGTHDGNITIRIMTIPDNFHREPFPVGRPCIRETVTRAILIFIVCHLPYLLRLQINNHQFSTVLDKGQFLSIRRELWGKPLFG